jgi:DNA-binding NarL/FixJ family response regulator
MERIGKALALAAVLFVVLAGIDQLADEGAASLAELVADLFEQALMAIAVTASLFALWEIYAARRTRQSLIDDLARARASNGIWRDAARPHLNGLGEAIHRQFEAWRLTPGEADVALLMLKGLSHKEIARLRNSSATTVRQQAAAVYGKSGLTSRAALSAYFLEDIFAAGVAGDGNGAGGPPLITPA